MVLKMLNNY